MNLTISSKSWHYRFMHFMDGFYNVKGYPAHDLCSYMRSLIWALLVFTVVGAFVLDLIPAYIEGWYLTVHLHIWSGGTHVKFPNAALALWAGISLIEWLLVNAIIGIASIALSIFGCVVLHEHYQERKQAAWIAAGRPTVAPKPPGLVRSWYRAFKQRVCPLLYVE